MTRNTSDLRGREPPVVTLEAKGKVFGRFASQVAALLRGKSSPSFRPDRIRGPRVVVKHVKKLGVTGRKETSKRYYHFSGYPGGLKTRTFGEAFTRDPERVFRLAVKRMLPKNRLAAKLLRRLSFTQDR